MANKPSPTNFIRSFGYHWSEYMSGGPSVPLMLAALFIDNRAAAIGTGLTGIACGLLSSYLVWRNERERVNELEEILAPKFKLSFDANNEGIVRTPEVFLHQGNPVTVPGGHLEAMYLRIQADALSNSVVQNCTAFITKIEKSDTWGTFVNVPSSHALSICEQPFDIRPQIPQRLDFAKTQQFDNSLVLHHNMPLMMLNAFKDSAIYRFTIAVNGGGRTQTICVDVNWTGQWDQITARQAR